ncbi:MAG TPA: uracil-DNA glycosylase [Thermoplasmata archaeon]|nr:uracil-DNA glycosylase [Thermoplasmata archaeon]
MGRSETLRGPAAPPRLARPRRIAPATRNAWRQLSDEIEGCRRCRLGSLRTRAVVYRGTLAPWVVFVGEAPGAAEDRAGIPFVGRSGQRLDAAIGRLGLGASEFGVLNVLKCRPPENRFDPAAARTCRPYLDRQLALLRPSLVVSLGASALRSLDPEAPTVLIAAGTPRRWGDRTLFPLIHPAAALRSRRLAERWALDLERLGRWIGRAAQTA